MSRKYYNVNVAEIKKDLKSLAAAQGVTLTRMLGVNGVNVGILTSCTVTYATYARKNGLPANGDYGRINEETYEGINATLGGTIDRYAVDVHNVERKQPEPEEPDTTREDLRDIGRVLVDILATNKKILEILEEIK